MAMLRSFLLLLMIFSMENAEARGCQSGWEQFGTRCFKFYPHLANWIRAERNCRSLGANLVSVRNKLENDLLLSLLPSSSTQAWVGGHDSVQEGQWSWSDGTVFLYTNWCPGEPNNLHRSENCLEINWTSNRCWNDADCSKLKSYFCVKDQ